METVNQKFGNSWGCVLIEMKDVPQEYKDLELYKKKVQQHHSKVRLLRAKDGLLVLFDETINKNLCDYYNLPVKTEFKPFDVWKSCYLAIIAMENLDKEMLRLNSTFAGEEDINGINRSNNTNWDISNTNED